MPNNYFSKLISPDFWKKPRHFWSGFLVLVGIAVTAFFMVQKEPKVSLLEVPLASGKQTYEILTGSPKKFKIAEVDLDPLDVKQGEIQTVRVLVKDTENEPIAEENKVEAMVYTDNISTPFSFSLKKVEDANSATITAWEGFWVCEDTYDLRYTITIKAKSATQDHSVDLSFR